MREAGGGGGATSSSSGVVAAPRAKRTTCLSRASSSAGRPRASSRAATRGRAGCMGISSKSPSAPPLPPKPPEPPEPASCGGESIEDRDAPMPVGTAPRAPGRHAIARTVFDKVKPARTASEHLGNVHHRRTTHRDPSAAIPRLCRVTTDKLCRWGYPTPVILVRVATSFAAEKWLWHATGEVCMYDDAAEACGRALEGTIGSGCARKEARREHGARHQRRQHRLPDARRSSQRHGDALCASWPKQRWSHITHPEPVPAASKTTRGHSRVQGMRAAQTCASSMAAT